ncbi:RIO1 family regulatory kinase/ATPase domain-containing protein [Salinicola avicenniae]|uniref:RIO1 family regulatory kinase/ATPase domain-containing protein n=1 Tax=Salinicola avicenniae TaxID=2916836 RepID=UPI002072E915|nr:MULTISPECIES: RIO1 family regulatory kinase/ATPase [unclassified Salinicola]
MGSLPDIDSFPRTLPGDSPLTPPPDTPILLQRGEGLLKADVVLTAHDGAPVVLKDYRRYAGTWMALPARLLIRHETRMLERLRDWPHSPNVVGHLGKLAMLLEYVPGEMLSESLDPANPLYFAQLMTALTSLHATSIVHNDVRGSNVIVHRGRLVLIDFASALYLPGGRLVRFLLKPMRRSDISSVLKFKARLTGEALTEEEKRLGRKPEWIRTLQRVWKKRLLPYLKSRFAGPNRRR